MFLGTNIVFLRKKAKLSQTQLGKLINMSRNSVASLEINRMKPSFNSLLKLREIFNISIDDLIFKELSNNNENTNREGKTNEKS